MFRTGLVRFCFLTASALAGSHALAAGGTPTPCTARLPLADPQSVQARAVTFAWQPLSPGAQAQLPAATAHAAPIAGTLLWPTATGGGPFPAVVLLHGSGGTQCDLYSAAQGLAARGYVALTLTQPDNRSASSQTSGVQALASALSFLASSASPARAVTQPNNAALIGHSEGAGVVSLAQGLPGFEGVRAIVALDNLRRWLVGDPGSAVRSCVRPPSGEVMPRVPALGFAKDGPCTASGDTHPEVKLSGFGAWQAHGIPAAELVPAGYTHLTFTDRKGKPDQLNWQIGLMAAWLDRWLKNETTALGALGCQAPFSASILQPQHLSTDYRSARFLPGQTTTTDLRATLLECP